MIEKDKVEFEKKYNTEVKTYPQVVMIIDNEESYIGGYQELEDILRMEYDYEKLYEVTQVVVENLDNVIDLNFYPTKEAENSNLKNRPVGLGMMALHDVLHKLNIHIDSDEAIKFSDKLFEFYSMHSIYASSLLAKERGKYETYEGSLWSGGVFPIDSYNNLMVYRGKQKVSWCKYS